MNKHKQAKNSGIKGRPVQCLLTPPLLRPDLAAQSKIKEHSTAAFSTTSTDAFVIGISVYTDFRKQRPGIPDAALHRQQGGSNADGGRVAVLRCDGGGERVAESQKWAHSTAVTKGSPYLFIVASLCHCLCVSPQTETVDSKSACTARAARLYHQITTLFPTRARSWRLALQVIWRLSHFSQSLWCYSMFHSSPCKRPSSCWQVLMTASGTVLGLRTCSSCCCLHTDWNPSLSTRPTDPREPWMLPTAPGITPLTHTHTPARGS